MLKVHGLADWWSRLSLAGQFTIAALVVLGCGMSMLGAWVTNRIEKGVVQNAAAGSALYINHFVEPLARDVSKPGPARDAAFRALDALRQDTTLGQRVVAIKIWAPDGTILYSTKKDTIGRKFPIAENLQKAVKGEVAAEFDPSSEENEFERRLGVPLLEIYSPVRDVGTKKVIAIGEFYEEASQLRLSLRKARLQSWYFVALVTLGMLAVLFGIVRRGSSTIASQQQALRDRIVELSRLLVQNKELLNRIDSLRHRSVETNDLVLRRVGAELHDGPAQLISLALLRLDALRPKLQEQGAQLGDYETIRGALSDSLTEIRNLAGGLVLPELDALSPGDAIRIAVSGHERRTRTVVKCQADGLPLDLSIPLKACLYRVVQEALNNAFRHAGGAGQTVRGCYDGGVVRLVVSDDGPGFPAEGKELGNDGLGLNGMRDRIASLGGSLEIRSAPGEGTRLTVCFKLEDDRSVADRA